MQGFSERIHPAGFAPGTLKERGQLDRFSSRATTPIGLAIRPTADTMDSLESTSMAGSFTS